MFATIVLACTLCGVVTSSGLHPIAPAGSAPIVTAASSQYFERTFNRLVAATPVLQPVIPVAPAPLPPPVPVAPARPVIPVFPVPSILPEVVDAIRTTSVPIRPTNPPETQDNSVNPNIAIAVATAHAAAPVATILLPPYPFGFPPSFGLVPELAQFPTENPQTKEMTTRESTTLRAQTTTTTTTERQRDNITPAPSNIDNNFAQPLPSNENVNFRQYLAPQPLPVQKPQKIKTSVEVVPVPLQYIAPPPVNLHHHHHHHHQQHHHHHHQAIKVIPHIHTFVPKPHKIIIRPISGPIRIRTIRMPAGLSTYGPPKLVRKISKKYSQNLRTKSRNTESTTFRPVNRPITKPPRV